MSAKFSGSEVAEIGIQIEKNGRDFYEICVSNAKNKKAKEIFELLRDQEEKHIVTFQNILKSKHSYEPKEAYPDEYFAYMNVLASQHVFTQKDKGKEVARGIKSDAEAIDVGIGFEKDSILLFYEMKNIVPEDDKGIVEALIEQEKMHLVRLTALKAELQQ